MADDSTVEDDIKAATGAQASPQPSPTPAPDESAHQDHVEDDIKNALNPTPEEKAPSAIDQISAKGPSKIDDVDRDVIGTVSGPDQIKELKQKAPWVPLSDEQHRAVYDDSRKQSYAEGIASSIPDALNAVGQGIKSFATGAEKLGNAFTYGLSDDPEWNGEEEGIPKTTPGKAIKDTLSAIPATAREVIRTGRGIDAGGTDLTDRAAEGLGIHSYEDSFKNYLARERVKEHEALYDANNPSTWAQVADYASPAYKPALQALVRLNGPDIESIKHEQPGMTDEQARAIQDQRASQGADDAIKETIAAQNENPEDPDLQTLGTFTLPLGNVFDAAGRVVGGVAGKFAEASVAGKTADQVNEDIRAAMKPPKTGKILPAIGKVGGYIDNKMQAVNDKVQGALSSIPEPIRPIVGRYLPIAGVGLGVGAEKYVNDPNHSPLSFLKGFAEGEAPFLIPRMMKDIGAGAEASAGGTTGALKAAAINPESSFATKALLNGSTLGNPQILDWLGNNAKDYAKTGVQTIPLALALGAAQSADPHEMGQILGQGLIYGFGGQFLHKALASDPATNQRIRNQQFADVRKTTAAMSPESQGNVAHMMSWDNVIDASKEKVDRAHADYLEAIQKHPEGSPEVNEAAQELANASRIHEMNQRANPQTRQEYARQTGQALTDLDQLVNGPLRAGKNVNIEALTTQQIADKLKAVNPQITPELAQQIAQTGAGAFLSRHNDGQTIDPFRDSVVVNMDNVKTRMNAGESFNSALLHEGGHALEAIPEWRKINEPIRDQLFGTQHYDAAGNLIAEKPGIISQKQLVEAFNNTYSKNLKGGVTPQQLAERLGLWDQTNNRLDEAKTAAYMQEEMLADLNAHGISQVNTKATNPILDWAATKQANSRVARAVHKVAGLGGGNAFTSTETGLQASPEIQAAKRSAVRELKKLNGQVSESVPINKKPDAFSQRYGVKPNAAGTISRNELMKNKALLEHYGKDSGLFKTEMQAIVTDANGDPVGPAIKISNPLAAEGSWNHVKDADGNTKFVQTRGYGQLPDELHQVAVPPGGHINVQSQLVYQPDGETPVLNSPKEVRDLVKSRGALIRQAIDGTPDQGAPNRLRAVSEDGLTYRGTMTPLQIKAIQDLPEHIVPRSIKEKLLMLNEAIARNDGTRFLGDYASRIDRNGRYLPFAPKHIDFIPVGIHFSKDGHFLVTTISVSRMFDKLNAWGNRMPAILSPWNGDAELFFNEMVEKYLKNWQDGKEGAEGLDPDPKVAQTKANTFNNFLNIYDKSTEHLNPERTPLPKKAGKLTKAERDDERSSDPNTIVRSRRLDAFADLIPHSGPKIPIDYEKAKINWMPAREKYPTSEEGLYSNLQKTIDEKVEGKFASPDQLKALINNPQSGIKPEEIKWTGVNDAIDRIASENGGKVPKDAVMEYLKNEGAVKFERVEAREPTEEDIDRLMNDEVGEGLSAEEAREYLMNEEGGTQYKDYSLPSGSNYTEKVLTMPPSDPRIKRMDALKKMPHTEENLAEYDRLSQETAGRSSVEYASSHFRDIPNYVAHIRESDHVIDGEKGRVIEEIQSDRHQAGKKEGYEQDDQWNDAKNFVVIPNDGVFVVRDEAGREWFSSMTKERADQRASELNVRGIPAGSKKIGVPDAPFRKDWPIQIFKRSLIDAVKDGKKWLGWVGGEEQADRYDLSKQVDSIRAERHAIGDGYSLLATKDGKTAFEDDVKAGDLEKTIGKSLAEKIISQPEKSKTYSGLDLKVGGEGMTGFYDRILPTEVKKFLKKIDPSATIEQVEIPKENGEGHGFGGKPRKGDVPMAKIWKVDITPEIERVVKGQGLPQFSPAREEVKKNLVAVHNTTEKKIEQALKIGGFAAPSMAIIRSDKSPYSNFGDITLVAHPDLVDPQANKHSRVFNADIYSPRYPSINYSLPVDQAKKLWKAINEKLPDMPSGKKPFWSLDTDRRDKPINEELRNNHAVQMAFLNDTDNLEKVKWKLAENPRYQDNVDQAAIRDAVTPWGETEGLGKQYEAWLDNLISKNDISEKEEIFKGYTPSGGRKYIPHSLDNVVKMMTKTIRDGEGFSYGVPSIRSNVAKQFKAMKDIAKSREHVVTKEEMESLKKEVNEEFQELADKAMPMRQNQGRAGFGQLEAFSDDLKALADGDMTHLREMYPDGAPFQEWRVYLEKLRNLPTEYFESKIQRGVQLNEFSGAIVPDDTSEGMLSKLKGLGLQVRTYPAGDQEARQGAVRDLSGSMDVHFQPARNSQSSSANDDIQKALDVLQKLKEQKGFRATIIQTNQHHKTPQEAIDIIKKNKYALGTRGKNEMESQEIALNAFPDVPGEIKEKFLQKEAKELGGKEHLVVLDAGSSEWIKSTIPTLYGTSIKDSPEDYLQNIKNINDLSEGRLNTRIIGKIENKNPDPPSIVTRQNHIRGRHPKSEDEMERELKSAGFTPFKSTKLTSLPPSWVSPDKKYVLWDIHPGNVVLTKHKGTEKITPVIIDGWVMPNEY